MPWTCGRGGVCASVIMATTRSTGGVMPRQGRALTGEGRGGAALARQGLTAAVLCVCGGMATASMTGQCSHSCLRELCSCDG